MLMVLYTWIVSVGVMAVLVISLVLCVCGCKKKMPRNELLGLAGLVKITNPDLHVDTFEVSPSVPTESQGNCSNSETSANSDKRKTTTNATGAVMRSLPDLPTEIREVDEKLKQPSVADTGSELYATLEDKTFEHRYAEIGNSLLNRASSEQREIEAGPFEVEARVEAAENISNIPAASAICGVVAANNDLPYMTPPALNNYFSGDSQDSTKGYTSISVREPISRIMSQTKPPEEVNYSHYTAVYDDSDDMYAAITDCYTSGSETYAQIKPNSNNGDSVQTTTSHSAVIPSTSEQINPNVISVVVSVHENCNPTNVVHFHQAVSTISPERNPNERRVINSPLPQPPANVDLMYAKVNKKKRETVVNIEHHGSNALLDDADGLSYRCAATIVNGANVAADKNIIKENWLLSNDPPPAAVAADNDEMVQQHEFLTNSTTGYETVNETSSNTNSNNSLSLLPPGYETIKEESSDCSIIGGVHYESVSEPNYEEICRRHSIKYNNQNNNTSSLCDADPNYEQVLDEKRDDAHFIRRTITDAVDVIRSDVTTMSATWSSEPEYMSLTNTYNDDTITGENGCRTLLKNSVSCSLTLLHNNNNNSDPSNGGPSSGSTDVQIINCNGDSATNKTWQMVNNSSLVPPLTNNNIVINNFSSIDDNNATTICVNIDEHTNNNNNNNNNLRRIENDRPDNINDLYSKVNKKKGCVT